MNSNSSQSEHLTPEQLDRLPEYRQKWLQFAWSTERVDQTIAIAAIQAMYRWVKLERPEIEFCANPLQLRERLEAYLAGDPERWRSPGYYSHGRRGSSWAKIHRLHEMLWPNLHGPTGHEALPYLGQHLQDPLEKHLERQWDTVRHEVGLHWRRGLEAQLWQVMQYPTWLTSQGAVIDFCITELGYIWKEDDWLIELGLPLGNQEQWQLVQANADLTSWLVRAIAGNVLGL